MRISKTALVYLLLAAILAVLPAGCSKKSSASSRKDKVVPVSDDDPEMPAAIAQARELLPKFWKTFDKPERGESDFALKVKITDQNGTEHFWVTDIERRDGQIHGTINNEPRVVKSVKLGEQILVPEADISDWLYMREGKMVGNYTLKALFKTMPPAEVRKYKRQMAEP